MASRKSAKAATVKTAIARRQAPNRFAIPSGYGELLNEIKGRIRSAQIKAALAVNRELIQLYWEIGRAIVERQQAQGWGAKVIDRLAADLQREFPDVAGLSRTNVYRMRAFYTTWSGVDVIVQHPVGQTGETPRRPVARSAKCSRVTIVPQPVGQFDEAGAPTVSQPARQSNVRIVPQAVGQLRAMPPDLVLGVPWGHNVILVERIDVLAQRLWYAQQTIEHGWSRAMLSHWIESDLYSRQGKAITNFKTALPAPQSDLAQQLLKDPYNFDFLTLSTDARERELEHGLLDHVRKFLLELGAGFAFVGQQVPLEVDGEDFTLDLLFYHLRLRAFVVIDLKAGRFKPEFAGKMNFYLSAVDDLLRHPNDQPSIGLILCKTRNKVVAEYALRDLSKPVGVARYATRLVESLPKELEGSLPSIAQVEAELEKLSRFETTEGDDGR